MKRNKRKKDRSLFDEDLRLEKLSKQGDPLLKLNKLDFEIFRKILESATLSEDKGLGGRPPYDRVLLFKAVILQRFYNISDNQIEYQINDRLSFMRFLNLGLSDDVPDSKTIWLFKEMLTKAGVTKELFETFGEMLEDKNLIAHEGTMIDASFVDVPKQRNSRDENKDIKSGKVPEDWKKEENKHKLMQKDTDARWTKKNNVSYFGYKDHVKSDTKSKLITNYHVTDASVHDSQALDELLDGSDKENELYADSAYTGQKQILEKYEVVDRVHERGSRNNPLTEQQKEENREKSKTRVRVEHIFGFIENSMNGSRLKTIGIERAKTVIGLMNLTYNMFRYLQICKV